VITSLKNQMVQRAKRLRDSRRFRHSESCVFVEGFEENKQALNCGWSCVFQLSEDPAFCEQSSESSYLASAEVMQELCKKSTTSVVGVYERLQQKSEDPWQHPVLFVLDEVEKPGNLEPTSD